MDRPIIRTNLTTPDPLLGVYVREAPDPADLAALMTADMAAVVAAGLPTVVCNWGIAGGGGGANWRAWFVCGLNPGWGLNTSPPIQFCRFACAVAQNRAELKTVADRLLASIPSGAFVWGTKIAGSGRDGSYMVAILYSEDGLGSGKLTYATSVWTPSGPYSGPTTIAAITIPQTLVADSMIAREYFVNYQMLLNDTAGSGGVYGRVVVNGTPRFETELTAIATDWPMFSGTFFQTQLTASDCVIELEVDVVGVNTVSVRGAEINAHLVNTGGAES